MPKGIPKSGKRKPGPLMNKPPVGRPGNKNAVPPEHGKWKPGERGNPNQIKDPPAIRIIKKLTQKELVDIGNYLLRGNLADLRDLETDPRSSVMTVMLASIVNRVINNGDVMALEAILNRLIGKVKDQLDLNATVATQNSMVVVTLPDNGRSIILDR